MTLPREAREGLARVWLALLREQHPGITWVIVDQTSSTDDDSVTEKPGQVATRTR